MWVNVDQVGMFSIFHK